MAGVVKPLILLVNLALLKVLVYALPIPKDFPIIFEEQTAFTASAFEALNINHQIEEHSKDTSIETHQEHNTTENIALDIKGNFSKNSLLRNVRPGQEVRQYTVEITLDGPNFNGRAVMDVRLDADTREDPIVFHAQDLDIQRVMTGIFTDANLVDTNFNVDDPILEIFPAQRASSYIVVVEYTGRLSNTRYGLYQADYNGNNYLAMNLHPTFARRVFPCIDEPTIAATISFTFNNVQYDHVVMNSMLVENSQTQYRPLQGPPHLWGMVAHSLNNIYFPTQNVLLNGRQGLFNQEAQATVAINHYFHALNEWTRKPYLEIVLNQDGRMNVIALPDSDRDWYALSSVCIWEPYVFMELTHSMRQRQLGLTKIAEAMARQWFGYVIYPENWRYQWVISGLTTYAAYEILKDFQTGPADTDNTLLDVHTLFVTEVIQESLLRDAYTNTQPLEPAEDIFNEEVVRDHVNGLLKYKAPAMLRMLRLVFGGPDVDHIQLAARALLSSRSLQTVNSLNFYDAIQSESPLVGDIEDFIRPWVETTGYPLIHIGLRQGGVLITQERFSFSPTEQSNFEVPLTFTTSVNPNFVDNNIYPQIMMETTMTVNMALGEEDWVLFNIQGQGYYRVNYDSELWERIWEALSDPERRQDIHPLNRATLVDDALNLARASKLDYDTAFGVVLTMEHETEYAVWKAFIRNMNFLRKRLEALVAEDEDLDPDIYLRMVRRTIGTFEDEIGFRPELNTIEPAMDSLTRGLVMDHACRSNYDPCIAAAIDWFYDPDNNDVINPNIPRDIRPAVYCTMAREGDDDVISALYDRLEIEPSHYERVVILESLACSQDDGFIRTLLEETIAANGPYSAEENVRIFKAVAESSLSNARSALNFMVLRTNEIRNTYGGPEKLEEVIFALADNMADAGLATDFINWVESRNSNLNDSEEAAERAANLVRENLNWDNNHIESVYEWIDENDAATIFVSAFLISVSLFITLFNH